MHTYGYICQILFMGLALFFFIKGKKQVASVFSYKLEGKEERKECSFSFLVFIFSCHLRITLLMMAGMEERNKNTSSLLFPYSHLCILLPVFIFFIEPICLTQKKGSCCLSDLLYFGYHQLKPAWHILVKG